MNDLNPLHTSQEESQPEGRRVLDIAQRHCIGPAPILGRESHTTDLNAFTEGLNALKSLKRSPRELAYHAPFWEQVEAILERCQKPISFRDTGDPETVSPKGPQDIQELVERLTVLSVLNPIYPQKLAEVTQTPLSHVITELLYATKVGITQMRWAPECIRCGSAVIISSSLKDLPAHAHCQGCQQANEINALDRVMVTFTLSSEILYILANNYACVPSQHSMTANACFVPMPGTNSGSGFQYTFGCDDQSLGDAIPAGKYRMHCPVSMTDNYLVVQRDAEPNDEAVELNYEISKLVISHHAEPRMTLEVPHGKLKFNLFPDTRSFFVLWIQEDRSEDELMHLPQAERSVYTTAAEIINHPSFVLFNDQIVPSSRPFEMKRVTLVFTDIVGSTAMYAHLGDGEALSLVQHYFEVLFNAFATRGRIVKTIGDAVMASFSSESAAIEGVAEALEVLSHHCVNPKTQEAITMRVGIHSGTTVAVSINGINDYFGQMVNIAARVQSAAGASECFISQDVLQSPRARATFERVLEDSSFQALEERELILKGVTDPLKVSGFIHQPTQNL